MKKIFAALLIVCAVFMLNAATLELRTSEFKNYKIGETITFKGTAKADDGTFLKDGKFKITLKYCGQDPMEEVEIDLAKGNPFTFTTKLDRAGFVFATPSSYKTSDGKYNRWKYNANTPYDGGAAVEPEKIRQAGTVPADFAKFWQDGIEAFKNAEVTVTPDPDTKREGYKVSRIKVDFPDGSGSINGFLSIPDGKGKFPAAVSVPGAGPGTVSPVLYIRPNIKAIELYLNVFPYPTEKTFPEMQKHYNAMNSKFSTKAYQREFAWDRDKYTYRKVWLAVSRAVDYVAALPQFDGKNFASTGHSQGGGTALAVAYLNKNISCVASSVPALCDHSGYLEKRQSGWPALHNTLKGRADKVSPYFDCATFASGIKVPCILSVGYVDRTCSPSSVYAAYNNITAPKTIIPMYVKGHRISPHAAKLMRKFLDRELSK